jgi:hypothetical protein
MSRKLAAALLAPLLLTSLACANKADDTTVLTGDAAVAALRAAPDAAAEAGSGRFEMTMAFDTPDGAFDITATGAYTGRRMSMEMDLGSALAELAAASGDTVPPGLDEPMRIVVDGTRSYMRFPMLDAVTGRSGWLSITPEDMGMASSALGLGAGADDPAQLLQTLRGVADDVTSTGEKEIRGVATTGYHATIDLDRALKAMPAEQQRAMAPVLEQLDGSMGTMPVDVWIDGDGLARRLRMDMGGVMAKAMAPGGGGRAMMTIDFFDYGDHIEVTVPDPSETTPFSEVMGGLGGAGGPG